MATNHTYSRTSRLQSKRMCHVFSDVEYWNVVYYYGSTKLFDELVIDRPIVPAYVVNSMYIWAERHKRDVYNVVDYIRSSERGDHYQLVSLAVILAVLARVNRLPPEWYEHL